MQLDERRANHQAGEVRGGKYGKRSLGDDRKEGERAKPDCQREQHNEADKVHAGIVNEWRARLRSCLRLKLYGDRHRFHNLLNYFFGTDGLLHSRRVHPVDGDAVREDRNS